MVDVGVIEYGLVCLVDVVLVVYDQGCDYVGIGGVRQC